ncbi:MAG: hypothetical protein U0176_14110 [Bacteroidia bacterium]
MGTNKTLYKWMAVAPILAIVLGLGGYILLSVAVPGHGSEPEAVMQVFYMFAAIAVAGALSLASFIIFLIHISRNRSIEGGSRTGWILGMIFANGITQIVYYFQWIHKEEELRSTAGTPANGF